MMKAKFGVDMQTQRVNQILKGFVDRDRMILKPVTRNGTTKPVNHFALNPNIPEVPENNVVVRHKLTLEILKHMKPVEFLNGKDVSQDNDR